MAHGVGEVVSEHGVNATKMTGNGHNQQHAGQQSASQRKSVGVMGSRRIFAATFKLKVLDSYRNDIDCRGNQRATARKYGIHRRQIQKWLQCEENLRSSCAENGPAATTTTVTSTGCCEIPVGRNGNGSPAATVVTTGRTTLPTTSSSSTNENPGGKCNPTSRACSGTPGTVPAPATLGALTTAPALNLSLARLHGDDENHRQTAAAPNHSSTPSATPTTRHGIPRETSSIENLGYNRQGHNHQAPSPYDRESQIPQQHRAAECHRSYVERQRTSEDRRMTEARFSYVSASYPGDEGAFVGAANPDGYYQALGDYRQRVGFANSVVASDIELLNASYSLYRDKNANETAGNEISLRHSRGSERASSSAVSPGSVVLHATAIKSERGSPDSLASSPRRGPCEAPGSPESAATMSSQQRRHEQQQQQQDYHRPSKQQRADRDTPPLDVCANAARDEENVGAAVADTAAIAALVAVHPNETASSGHVHVGVDAAHAQARLSEKRQREREERRYGDGIREEEEEYGEGIRRTTMVKEEVAEGLENEESIVGGAAMTTMTPRIISDETKREITREEEEDEEYHGEFARASDARTPTGSSSVDSSDGPTSPITRDSNVGRYSGLSSPRAASSSGISTSSSCSDSEIDPLDYSSTSATNTIGDLSRRRSFSLRFKLDVLNAFHSDIAVAGNQRATARKFGINRRQVQKWLGQESELRGEIALRGGDLRQRLGPMSELSGDSTLAVDLRTSSSAISSLPGTRSDNELENFSSPLYCCDIGSSASSSASSSSPHGLGYYGNVVGLYESPEGSSKNCTLSCCLDNNVNCGDTTIMCPGEATSQRRYSSGYPESRSSLYCYSPRDWCENGNEAYDVTMTNATMPAKRPACTLNCCYEALPSPKRVCTENIDEAAASCREEPPQEVPLCLVKPKESMDSVGTRIEPVTSTTVATPSAQRRESQPAASVPSGNKRDAILFKPYLDNPVRKPTNEEQQQQHPNLGCKHGGLSPHTVIVNNNNNCQGICNLNEERSMVTRRNDYALELSLRVPVNWPIHHGAYGEFPERLRSAFVRYPTSPHYT